MLATTDELSYLVDHSECLLSVTQTDLQETVSATAKRLNRSFPILVTDADSADGGSWSAAEHAVADTVDSAAESAVGVLYTSGTTCRPKGVVISHSAYLTAGEVVAGQLRLRPDDRQLWCCHCSTATPSTTRLCPRW